MATALLMPQYRVLWSKLGGNSRLLSVPRRSISYIGRVDDVPAPGAFSRAVVDQGKVYVSGTGAGNDTGGDARIGTAFEETTWALENIAAILEAAGSSVPQTLSVTMLLTEKNDYAECNKAYIAFFEEHGAVALPARSTALWGVPTTAKVAFSCVANVEE